MATAGLDDDVGGTFEVQEELVAVSKIETTMGQGGHTLSPQMVFLPHVLSVKAAFRVNLQAVDSLMVCQKRVFGNKFVGLGIWNLSRFALNL